MGAETIFHELSVKYAKQVLDFVIYSERLSLLLRDEVKTRVLDAINSRISIGSHYSGDQLRGMFDDIPDMVEREVGTGLERLRNVVMLMLTRIFAQAREKRVKIGLGVSLLEEETRMKASRQFCEGLLKKPDEVLEQVGKPKRSRVVGKPNEKMLAAVRAEIAELCGRIGGELEGFAQYKKTLALIGEKQVEVERLELRAGG